MWYILTEEFIENNPEVCTQIKIRRRSTNFEYLAYFEDGFTSIALSALVPVNDETLRENGIYELEP